MVETVLAARTGIAWWRPAAISAAYIASYIALDWVSYVAPIAPFAITPWNPHPGLTVAFLIVCGGRYWPVLFVAALLADAVVRGLPAATWLSVLNAAVITVGYSLAAGLLRSKLGPGRYMTSLRQVAWLVGVAAIVTLPIASSYVAVLTAVRMLPLEAFASNMAIFWVGDVIGIVITTPVLLVAWQLWNEPWSITMSNAREAGLQAAAVALVLLFVFGFPITDEFKFFYLLFLPLIWVAMRFGFAGAAFAILCIQIGLIVGVQRLGRQSVTIVELQFLMLTLAVTGLFLGMAVTERRRALNDLRVKGEELVQALRLAAASEMSSALAHELNQPLAAVSHLAWASRKLLNDETLDRALLADALDKTVIEARRAGGVVHRLRELYKLGAVRLEKANAAELVHNALEPLSARIARHKVNLSVSMPKPPPLIEADTIQIAAVLHNLVANAIDAISADKDQRGTPAQVAVSAQIEGESIVFAVDDSGPGVPPELRPSLFTNVQTTKSEGLGLGLAISRSIVEAHDGKIWLESSSLGGARFCFSLPHLSA